MNRFSDKVVVITGGSSGIGLAAAQAFEEEGANVVVTGRNPETLAAATKVLSRRAITLAYFTVQKALPLLSDGGAIETAKAVTFLASADASYITGTELAVDGGRTQL